MNIIKRVDGDHKAREEAEVVSRPKMNVMNNAYNNKPVQPLWQRIILLVVQQ
jgi:hypothetical protein